eukprot:TRINITY_DN11033_c0_g1_i1.p1 TRINITY_DN11033_c0_g1~~TRINITY_DN11033_c0_g1_i1.p1  ORF type:complete len:539 (+),score=141.61 TRINITY_DN11033_c0_g1_i1:49-1617(+)
MSTLADAFLQDLEDDGDEEQQEEENFQHGERDYEDDASKVKNEGDENDDDDKISMDLAAIEEEEEKELEKLKYTDVTKLATLRERANVKTLLSRISESLSNARSVGTEISGPLEEDPEYKLIVESNTVLMDIGLEIVKIHKFLLDHYSPRFPELEQLVLNPMDYVRVVKKIGSEKNLATVDLTGILPAATIMIVIVTASNTSGKPLPNDELEKVFAACDEMLYLDDLKQKLLSYVESRMLFIAPNLSALVGSSIAAQLVGVAGGLQMLSRLPSSILQLLGAKKKTLGGFSSASTIRHTGFIFDCDIIRNTPPSFHTKACRLIAGKCTIAARVDSFHESPRGDKGIKLRAEVEKKIEKWQEPPPAKMPKPLPAPDDKQKKRRGGRRQRKLKEKFAPTELRKYANRMSFGVAEDTFGDSEKGLGMISKSGKVKLSGGFDKKGTSSLLKGLNKKNQKRLGISNNTGTGSNRHGSATTSGLSSSLAFTPIQGLELHAPTPIAPNASKSESGEARRYFGNTTFAKIK